PPHTTPPYSLLHRHPPPPPLFPYTTLFRSPSRWPARRSRGRRLERRVHGRGEGRLRAREARARGRNRPDGPRSRGVGPPRRRRQDRKSTRLNSSHVAISYAVFCLKKKKNKI